MGGSPSRPATAQARLDDRTSAGRHRAGHRPSWCGHAARPADAGQQLSHGARLAVADDERLAADDVDPVERGHDGVDGVVDVRGVDQGGATVDQDEPPDAHARRCGRPAGCHQDPTRGAGVPPRPLARRRRRRAPSARPGPCCSRSDHAHAPGRPARRPPRRAAHRRGPPRATTPDDPVGTRRARTASSTARVPHVDPLELGPATRSPTPGPPGARRRRRLDDRMATTAGSATSPSTCQPRAARPPLQGDGVTTVDQGPGHGPCRAGRAPGDEHPHRRGAFRPARSCVGPARHLRAVDLGVVPDVDREPGHDQDRRDVDAPAAARIESMSSRERHPGRRERGLDDDDNDLLGPDGPTPTTAARVHGVRPLDPLLDAHRGHDARRPSR